MWWMNSRSCLGEAVGGRHHRMGDTSHGAYLRGVFPTRQNCRGERRDRKACRVDSTAVVSRCECTVHHLHPGVSPTASLKACQPARSAPDPLLCPLPPSVPQCCVPYDPACVPWAPGPRQGEPGACCTGGAGGVECQPLLRDTHQACLQGVLLAQVLPRFLCTQGVHREHQEEERGTPHSKLRFG